MDDERLQVLQMVASGTISPEEGGQLLDALGIAGPRSHQSETRPYGEARRPSRPRHSGRDAALSKLIEARDHGVSAQFMHDMREAGLGDLTLEQLIELRDHGVNAAFVQEMRDWGFIDLTPSQLIELRDHGVDATFVDEMHNAFGNTLRAEESEEPSAE